MAVSKNTTNAVSYEWEYYYDYIEPLIVEEGKLRFNKYSIVIIFWITLAAFVGFLFFSLNLISRNGNVQRSRRSTVEAKPPTSQAGSNV